MRRVLWRTVGAGGDDGDRVHLAHAERLLGDWNGVDTPVFQGDAASGYVLSSPVNGTVTSWSFLNGTVSSGSFVLRILRPADSTGQAWTAVGTSTSQSVSAMIGSDTVQGPFATNLQIKVGDRIALEPISAATDTPIENIQGANGVRYFTKPFADGSTATITPGSNADNDQIVPVQATIQSSPPPVNGKPPTVVGAPKAGQTLSCDPGTWTGAQSFSYAWSLSTLTAVASGSNRPPRFVHTTIQIGTAQSLTLGDYRPGSSTLSCTATASNANGSVSLSSASVTVQAVRPALGSPVHIGRRTISPQPHITPGVGAGGRNFCSTGLGDTSRPRSRTRGSS